MEGFINI